MVNLTIRRRTRVWYALAPLADPIDLTHGNAITAAIDPSHQTTLVKEALTAAT